MFFVYLLLLLTVVPLVELSLLIAIDHRIGLAATIGLVLLTGVVGAALARRQGLEVLWRLRGALARGEAPTEALVDGALVLVAGAVLLTPGVLTDAVGFALLIPPIRSLIKRALWSYFKNRVRIVGVWGTSRPGQPPPQDREVQIEEAKIIDVRIKDDPRDSG